MIIRIVKMKFSSDKVNEFTTLFEERKQTIRSFPGCSHLELWQDAKDENTFFTYSIWDSEADLGHYRFSEFFKDTWGRTKALFAEKAEAWSVIPKSAGQ
jgi:quinol monooxygenase YgiN